MHRFSKAKIIALLIFISIFQSCISYKEVKIEEIKSVRMKDDNFSSGKIVAILRINNPNNYAIKIKEYNLNASIDEMDMGKILVDEKIIIPSKSNDDYTLTFAPDVAKLLGILPGLLIKGSAEAGIKGNVKVKALIFSKRFNVDLKKKVSTSDFR